MLGEEQLQPHVAIGDHPPVAVMRVARGLLDALGDSLIAQLRLQHLILVVLQEIILHVGLDRLVQQFVFAGLEEAGDGGGDGLLQHDIRALPLEEPIGIGGDRRLAILEGEREAAIDVLMRRLLDARPLLVEYQDRVVDEFVGFRLAGHDLVQRPVDVLDDEIDRVRRQGLVAEEDVEHALVGVHRRGVVEMPVIAPIEGRAERDDGIDAKHDADGHADGLQQHAERARAHHCLAATAKRDPAPPALGRRADHGGDGIIGMGGKGNALGFGHVVQHVF